MPSSTDKDYVLIVVSPSVPQKIILSNLGFVEASSVIIDIDEKLPSILFDTLRAMARKRGGNAIVNLSIRRHIIGPSHGGLRVRVLVCAYGDVVVLDDTPGYSVPLPPPVSK